MQRSIRLPDAGLRESPTDESFDTAPGSRPQHTLFTLICGFIVLSIFLTGAVVLVARLIPFT